MTPARRLCISSDSHVVEPPEMFAPLARRLGSAAPKIVHTEMGDQLDFLEQPYHQAILNDEIPLSIGGGIGQARTYMYFLRTAHLGEVTVSVWPQQLKDICAERNIHVLE